MSNKFNTGQVHDFVGKTAERRYLEPIGLNKYTVSSFAQTIDTTKERDYFKALHYVRYRLSKEIEQNGDISLWDKICNVLRNRLVVSYLRLVHDCIQKTSVRIDDYDTMVSLGNEAVISAVEGFDPWQKYKFSTYACRCIFHRFYGVVRSNRGSQSCIDVSEIDVPLPQNDPDMELYIERLKIAVEQAGLTEREKGIISLRFASPKKTLKEVSQMYNLSKERIRQVENLAIDKLRKYLKGDDVLR